MNVLPTDLNDVLVIEPKVFGDARGFFMESFNARNYARSLNTDLTFVQDNFSRSARNVLRGLHYQIRQPQGKLITVLDDENHRQLWVPPGFAHGFMVLSDTADVLYKTTDYYAPEHERCIIWNDPDIGIHWPLDGAEPILSSKDRLGISLAQAEVFV
jgi:dTDP-4-dehydrorhamnose 3,5-epimerase